MSKLIRYPAVGRPVFVTSVTFKRNPILIKHTDLFLSELDSMSIQSKAVVPAWSLLPDHFHLLIDTEGDNLSRVMQRFKIRIAHGIRVNLGVNQLTVWQPRFWDHVIRNEKDLRRHLNYIHYNAVKHGYVENPADWHLSSFREFLARGDYPRDWGVKRKMSFEGEFGE